MTPTTALAFDLSQDQMIIESDLLGAVEVAPDELFRFAQGLFGFPDCHDFVLLAAEKPGLYWLQSAEYPTLTFLMVDPFVFFDGYSLDLGFGDLRDLAVEDPDDVSALAIVTLPSEPGAQPTANLQGPVAFNLRTRLAKQVVFDDTEHDLRCAFDLDRPAAAR